MTLKTFSGGPHQNVKHWLRSVESTAVHEQWTAHQKLAAAYALLIGPAASWLDYQKFHTWQQFEIAITKRFGDDVEVALQKLMTAQQKRYEDVQTYLERIYTLVNICEKNDEMVPPCMIKRLFINGLSTDIRQKVKDCRPLDLESAAGDAKYFEGMYEDDSATAQATSMTKRLH